MKKHAIHILYMSKEDISTTHRSEESPENMEKLAAESGAEAIFERAETMFDSALSPDGRVAFIIHEGGRNGKPNEDRIVINARENQYASIDGMGGKAHGARAAQILAEKIVEGFKLHLSPRDIQQRAYEHMQKEEVGEGGACYIAFTLDKNMLHVYGAGDCKLKVLRKGKVVRQTVPEEGEEPGSVSNAVTGRFPGTPRIYDPFTLETRDRIIAGSDGFWEQFTNEEEISELISGKPADEAVHILNHEAMKRQKWEGGYKDNLNIIIKDFDGSASEEMIDTPQKNRLQENPEERIERKEKAQKWFRGGKEKTADAPNDYWHDVKENLSIQGIIADALMGDGDAAFLKREQNPKRAAVLHDELLRALASGSLGMERREELLLRIHAPFEEKEKSESLQALFKEIAQFEGKTYSMPKLVAELAGHPDENLTPEMLGDMLRQYPDPRMLRDRAERTLINHRKTEGYEQFIRVTLRSLYGRRHEYAEQFDLLSAEAEKTYPKLAGETRQIKKEIGSIAGMAEELGRQRASEKIFGIMEQRVEEILRRFERRYQVEHKPFDESILYDPAFVNARYGDEIIIAGAEKSAEVTGIYGWGRNELTNLDLRALKRVLERELDREKIKKYPYGIE